MQRGGNKSKLIILIIIILLLIGVFVYFKFYKDDKQKSPITGTQIDENNTINNSLSLSDDTYDIRIQSYKFYPEILRIKAGDTITWTNADIVPHTITSDSNKEIDSKEFNKDETFSHKFDQKGAYSYHCKLHSRMQGTIIVE